jgi:hypothetical protein
MISLYVNRIESSCKFSFLIIYCLMPFLESNFNSQHRIIAAITPPVSPPPPILINSSTQPPPGCPQGDDSGEAQHVSKRQRTTTPSGDGQEEVKLGQTFGGHQGQA